MSFKNTGYSYVLGIETLTENSQGEGRIYVLHRTSTNLLITQKDLLATIRTCQDTELEIKM